MYDVQAALERTGIPAFRSAYRAGQDETVPESYVIYAVVDTPTDFFDDQAHGMMHRATLHLCTRGDPAEMAQAIAREMSAEGFSPSDEQDAYDEHADLYLTITEWRGEE